MPTRTFLAMSSSVPKRVSPSGCSEVRRFWLPALLPWHACPALLAHAASAAVLSSGSGSHLGKFSDEGSHESVAECVVLPLVFLGFHSCCDCPLSDSGTQALTIPPGEQLAAFCGKPSKRWSVISFGQGAHLYFLYLKVLLATGLISFFTFPFFHPCPQLSHLGHQDPLSCRTHLPPAFSSLSPVPLLPPAPITPPSFFLFTLTTGHLSTTKSLNSIKPHTFLN